MESGSTARVIQILVGHEIFEDGTLPPLYVDDVISVKLFLVSSASTSEPGTTTYRVTVQPEFGHAPWAGRDETLRWPFQVTGDGWTATWRHHSPAAGLMRVTGFLTPDFHRAVPGQPGVVTGRVRRLQLLERQAAVTQNVHGYVPGTERLRDLGSSPDRYWPEWFHFPEHGQIEESGILVDLDLDAIPDQSPRFDACAVSISGPDVWVLDRSAPVLMHLDISRTPAVVTEYLLPLAFEPPADGRRRRLHSDSGGCWITCPAEIVRCDHTGFQEVTVRRVTMDGGDFTVHADGRLFAITQPYPYLRDHHRYGMHRLNPEEYPFRELIDGVLTRIEDEDTIALAWDRDHRRRADQVEAPDGTKCIGNVDLTTRAPDGAEQVIDLDDRTRGRVHWIRPDPVGDPANADIIDPIIFPPAWQK